MRRTNSDANCVAEGYHTQGLKDTKDTKALFSKIVKIFDKWKIVKFPQLFKKTPFHQKKNNSIPL